MLRNLRGREARAADRAANLLRTLQQASLFWLLFFAATPAALFKLEPPLGLDAFRFVSNGWRIAGIVLFAAAGILNLASAYALAVAGQGTPLPTACPRRLVIAGPYRHLRNPMAASALAQGAAVGLFLGSPLVVAYAALGALFWQLLVRPWEDADLELRFGESYRQYRAALGCWIPHLRGYVDETADQYGPATSGPE